MITRPKGIFQILWKREKVAMKRLAVREWSFLVDAASITNEFVMRRTMRHCEAGVVRGSGMSLKRK